MSDQDQKWQIPAEFQSEGISTPDEAADWVSEILGMSMGAMNMDNQAKKAAEAGKFGECAFCEATRDELLKSYLEFLNEPQPEDFDDDEPPLPPPEPPEESDDGIPS